ncbi:type I secretion protein [Mameliella sediminis]|uniref:type I secretion protein n=1 Tax=Mameliella sediminis TaxID=2836866 RepID=UPI001C48C816|nr:type I secretion protein [Mameliella sediminis]MBV7395774.1 type I secretion protein [Mameliella sediminis]
MPILPVPLASFGEAATAWLFGGNILAPRTTMTGPGSYAEAVETLGVTSLRYPGGSLTESYFDLSNPDASVVVHNETGAQSDFMPISDIMGYAAETGRAVTIVLPTRDQISTTRFDDNGDRYADVDEGELRAFVRDVVSGEYGDAPLAGFEIGNEYWGSGRMNAVEYGRVAAEMTRIIDSELQALLPLYPEAAEVDILVQMGTNFGESSLDEAYDGLSNAEIIADLNATYGLDLPPGRGIDWTEFNNLLVMEQFDAAEMAAVDGVIAHVYSRGADMPHTRYFALNQIQDTWIEENPDLEIHVSEWNLRSNSDSLIGDQDYGLFQAQEMLEQVEAFMAEGVDAAQVWPLIQNTPSALGLGMDWSGSTPPGEMFALMSANIPGMTMLDFAPADPRETEFVAAGIEVHGFADGEDMLLYVTAPQGGGVVQSVVDLAPLVADVGAVEIVVLGVGPGQAPGDSGSDAVLERVEAAEVWTDGELDVVLSEGEIMQVRLIDVTPTESFAPVFDSTSPEAAEQADLSDTLPEVDLPAAQPAFAPTPEDMPQDPPAEPPNIELPVLAPGDTTPSGPDPDPEPVFQIWGEGFAQPAAPVAPVVSNPLDRLVEFERLLHGPANDADQRSTAAAPEDAAQELLRLLGFAPGSEPDHAAPDLFDAFAETQEPEEDLSGTPDDMGLGWALAVMPLLAASGLG